MERLFVLIGTYNHESFISQAIEGALAQKVDLPFKIIVRDDASSDSTPKIISKYARDFPEVIIPILYQTNQQSIGRGWSRDLLRRVARKTGFRSRRHTYVAFCEGDDYWTDPEKLQVQVDLLRQHPEVSFVHHPVTPELSDGGSIDFFSGLQDFLSDWSNLPKLRAGEELTQTNPIYLASVLMRLSAVNFKVLKAKPQGVLGDWTLFAAARGSGPIGFERRAMAVYRVHKDGVFSGKSIEERESWMERTLGYFRQKGLADPNL